MLEIRAYSTSFMQEEGSSPCFYTQQCVTLGHAALLASFWLSLWKTQHIRLEMDGTMMSCGVVPVFTPTLKLNRTGAQQPFTYLPTLHTDLWCQVAVSETGTMFISQCHRCHFYLYTLLGFPQCYSRVL